MSSTVLQPIAHNAQEAGGAFKGAKPNEAAIHSALLRDQGEKGCIADSRVYFFSPRVLLVLHHVVIAGAEGASSHTTAVFPRYRGLPEHVCFG